MVQQLEQTGPSQARAGEHPVLTPYDRKPIDLDHLSNFTFGNVSLMQRLLKLFIQETEMDLLRLASAKSANEWRKISHTINNSACAIGAWRISTTAEFAEDVYGDPNSPGCGIIRLALEKHFGEAKAYITSLNDGELSN